MMKFHAEKQPYGKRIALHVVQEFPSGQITAATSLTFVSVAEGEFYPQAALSLTNDEAQMLIDALWDAGLRPSEGSGSAGAMLATQQHLADMRQLVAKQLDVKLKDC